MPDRYIIVNGIKMLNPAFKKSTTVAHPDKALVILPTPEDLSGKSSIPMSQSVESSLEILRDEGYVEGFNIANAEKQQQVQQTLEQGLFAFFSKYEIPLGTINKLLMISEDEIYFIQDDSGSMMAPTDSSYDEASEYIKSRRAFRESFPANRENVQKYEKAGMSLPQHKNMTRWEEAEDRLHALIDILAFIPNPSVIVKFLNRRLAISFTHNGLSPAEFAQKAHKGISEAFDIYPILYDLTPIHNALEQSYILPLKGKRRHVLLATDGEPSPRTAYTTKEERAIETQKEIQNITALVEKRRNPELFPTTFLSCTNDDKAVVWTKILETNGPWVAELDDFKDERAEIAKAQGPAFPYNKGLWLISNLVAAVNPGDLDALDESIPLSRFILNNLLGYQLSEQEYAHFWQYNPNAAQSQHLYLFFLNEFCSGRELVRKDQTGELQKEQQARLAQNQAAAAAASSAPQYSPQYTIFQPVQVQVAQQQLPAYTPSVQYQ